jgi:glucose/arabinose dehydrogenase
MLGKYFIPVLLVLVAAGCVRQNGAGGTPPRPGWPQISLTRVAGGFHQPTHITHAGDGSGRLFVVQRDGRIRIISEGTMLSAPFLDISNRVGTFGSEQGLLGLAFPPDYAIKGYFYVNFTEAGSGSTVVARYRVTKDHDAADPSSGETLLTVRQPYSNHNGGQLAFGPDGYLYIGMGDGGSGGDPMNNGQRPDTLLGKLLRIDAETPGTRPYSIPPGNPFMDMPGYRDEIWAVGLRNPWRFSFDRTTGDLYIADVGQDSYEEIDFQPAAARGGENYGWRIMEGLHCFRPPGCDGTGLVLPVAEYDHSDGNCSVTGGMVYRGSEHPALQGIYLYGDFCSGRIWGLRKDGPAWEAALLLETPYYISTFGEDEDGGIYLADYKRGDIYLIGGTGTKTGRPEPVNNNR